MTLPLDDLALPAHVPIGGGLKHPSLKDWYAYQKALRSYYYQQLTHGLRTGTGYALDDWLYGRGFEDRWTRFGHGRYATNIAGLFGGLGLVAHRDKVLLDPLFRAQRDLIRAGGWQPGMQIDKLIVPTSFGWTNPIGPLAKWFGIVPNEYAQRRALHRMMGESPAFQRLLHDFRKGLLSSEDLDYLTRGTSSSFLAKQYWDAMSEAHKSQVAMRMKRLGELVEDIRQSHQKGPI